MKIVIFQPMLKFYRVPLYELLHAHLLKQGHDLRVVFGTPWSAETKRNDNVLLQRDYFHYEKSHWFYHQTLHFLPGAVKHILWADIIITEQANKHLHNYLLALLSLLKLKRFAYWGHGANRQGDSASWREKIKKKLAIYTDWWFAYTEGVADYLIQLGYPKERITVLHNSVDTRDFEQELNALSTEEITDFKNRHGIPLDAQIGLFCGSIYKEKKLEFILESAMIVKQRNPNFVLLIGGSGDDVSLVKKFSEQYHFVIYLGSLHGKEKTLAFKAADIFICPGLVGLAILDAFTASLPLFTTYNVSHGPEIEYLQHGYNGMLSEFELGSYTDMIVDTLANLEILAEMSENANATSHRFSIENMAQNFFVGIEKFLASVYPK